MKAFDHLCQGWIVASLIQVVMEAIEAHFMAETIGSIAILGGWENLMKTLPDAILILSLDPWTEIMMATITAISFIILQLIFWKGMILITPILWTSSPLLSQIIPFQTQTFTRPKMA